MLPTILSAVIVLALSVSARPQDSSIQIRAEQAPGTSTPSQIQNPAEPSKDVPNSSTIPPSSPPPTTTSPVALGQTLASSAVTITISGTVSSSKPSVIVTSATRALTVDAVVVASQSLSSGAPSGTNALNVLPSASAHAPAAAGPYANNIHTPSSPPSTTTSPVASGQTLASSAVTITPSRTVSFTEPSIIVTNGTAIPSATPALTVDAVVVASQSLSPGAPSVTNSGWSVLQTHLNVLPSVPAPSPAVANAHNVIIPSSPPSTTTTPMLPSQILSSGLPRPILSRPGYYSNSSYVITTRYSTPVTLATGSVNDVGGVTTSAFGGVAVPTQAKGTGVGGASGGATLVDTSGAGTHRLGVGMGLGLVMGIFGVVFGSLGAL